MNIQNWFPLGLIGLISLQSKGLSKVFANTTIQKHQFSGTQSSLWGGRNHIPSGHWQCCGWGMAFKLGTEGQVHAVRYRWRLGQGLSEIYEQRHWGQTRQRNKTQENNDTGRKAIMICRRTASVLREKVTSGARRSPDMSHRQWWRRMG